jgi:hypothetical protein
MYASARTYSARSCEYGPIRARIYERPQRAYAGIKVGDCGPGKTASPTFFFMCLARWARYASRHLEPTLDLSKVARTRPVGGFII